MNDIESFAKDLTEAIGTGGFINVFGEPGTLKSYLAKMVIQENRSEIAVVEGEIPETTHKVTPRQNWSWTHNNQGQLEDSPAKAPSATVVVSDGVMDFYFGRKVRSQVEVSSSMAREALLDRDSVVDSIRRGVEGAIVGKRGTAGMSL